MNILTLDVETTTSNKGHWADKQNKLVSSGLKWLDQTPATYDIREYSIEEICRLNIQALNKADIVVGHNIKFDLHWLCNIGVDISNIKQIWDTQIAEFLLMAQRNPYNSLNDALQKYGYPLKLDGVKTEYWDKGIDTDEIPVDILREYLEYDLIGTENVFKEQAKQFGRRL